MDLNAININFWILQSLAMGLTALLIPNLRITNPLGALATVVAMAFVNAHLWDAALFFSVPNTLSTHAIMLLLSNGIIFWIIVKVLPGIEVDGVLPALAAPIVFSLLSVAISTYAKDVDWLGLGKQGMRYVQDVRDKFRDDAPGMTAPVKVGTPDARPPLAPPHGR